MDADRRPALAVIGAGPAGLMAAEVAARAGAAVTVYERMPSPARKFLLAGRGGLNLTHSEPVTAFLARYGAAMERMAPFVETFGPADLRAWSAALGEPTMIGSSGRVFPRSFKTSPLLRAWLRQLDDLGVAIRARHRWTGWSEGGALRFETPQGPIDVTAEATVLALGGASWPRLGADGAWTAILAAAGLAVAPLAPSNCGFLAAWSARMTERFAGQPLKNVAVRFGQTVARGEVIITRQGLEGGPIYALSGPLREAIAGTGEAVAHIDLRPDMTVDEVARRLTARPAKASLSTALRKALALSPAAIGLVHEARHRGSEQGPVAALVKAVPVALLAAMPLAEAISTAGGVRFAEVDERLMLRRRPGVFVAGEMLDWEAPTGGYLLQGCFSTGAAAGRGAADWLGLADAAPREPQSSR